MFVFRKIWRALLSWNTRFEVYPFTLFPTNSKIYTLGLNNLWKRKGNFNATIENSGFEVYTCFYVIDKLKTWNLLSKNFAEKLKILEIKDENINEIN